MENQKNNKYSFNELFKFIFPSLIGLILFIIPVKSGDGITIPIALLSNAVLSALGSILPQFMVISIGITFIFTIITKLFKPKAILENKFFNNLFNVSPLWALIRILGFIFIICALFKIGPEWIWSENTGGLLLYDLLPLLFSIFVFAGMLLPLLLDFGLLEFVGALLTRVMRPIFNLPGRSSIDCMASWLGDGTIGVLLTSKQYEEGYYSEREATVIGTTFSAVSITFCLAVISQVKLSHMFVPFYLTVCLSGIVAAILILVYHLFQKNQILI